MRRLHPTVLGSPVGRFRFDVFELPAVRTEAAPNVRRLDGADLDLAVEDGLLGEAGAGRDRLADGDIALGVVAPGGGMLGIVWLSIDSHVDRYGGRWTVARPPFAYLNQLLIRPDYRRQGLGSTLIRAGQAEAEAAGRTVVRALVKPGNEPSRAAFVAAGGSCVRHLYGLRVGPVSLRVTLTART